MQGLEKLKQYKEIIAIIIFFLGGFFWLQAEFPNKSDLRSEVGSLNCQLKSYMLLTQLQIGIMGTQSEVQVLRNAKQELIGSRAQFINEGADVPRILTNMIETNESNIANKSRNIEVSIAKIRA